MNKNIGELNVNVKTNLDEVEEQLDRVLGKFKTLEKEVQDNLYNSEEVINEDELVGFISRKLHEVKSIRLDYEEIRAVLDLEFAFLDKKGLIESEGDE